MSVNIPTTAPRRLSELLPGTMFILTHPQHRGLELYIRMEEVQQGLGIRCRRLHPRPSTFGWDADTPVVAVDITDVTLERI